MFFNIWYRKIIATSGTLGNVGSIAAGRRRRAISGVAIDVSKIETAVSYLTHQKYYNKRYLKYTILPIHIVYFRTFLNIFACITM